MNTPISIGIISAIVTEIFKFVPALRQNALVQALVAIVVIAGTTLATGGSFTGDSLVGSLVVALTTYKSVVQPLSKTFNYSSQN